MHGVLHRVECPRLSNGPLREQDNSPRTGQAQGCPRAHRPVSSGTPRVIGQHPAGSSGTSRGRHRSDGLTLTHGSIPSVVGMDTSSKSTTFSSRSGISRTGLEARLFARPEGLPAPGDFEITEVAVPDPANPCPALLRG